LLACLTMAGRVVARGQDFRYSAPLLGCAVFEERVESVIQTGGQGLDATLHREGTLVVQVRDSASTLDLTAWYDTLVVWRETTRGREVPDPSGVFGGRFRGRLDARGAYTRVATPFIPDDLRAVVDLGTALSDFFPRLPDSALAVGGEWRRPGQTITREKPIKESTGAVDRLRWTLRKQSRDTVQIEGRDLLTIETIEERGRLRWTRERGPIGWTREIEITVDIPVQANVKKAHRTKLRQRIKVDRSITSPLCR
jgi:hypothetical protein